MTRGRVPPFQRVLFVGLSVTDQAVSSAGNLAVTVIAARNLGVDEFGAFSVTVPASFTEDDEVASEASLLLDRDDR